MTIKPTPTPYPDGPSKLHPLVRPIEEGLFDSYTEVLEMTWKCAPPLDQPLLPGQVRTAKVTKDTSDAYVTFTNGLRIPMNHRDVGRLEPERYPRAGHDIVNAQGQKVAEVVDSTLRPSCLSLQGAQMTQSIFPDGTTDFSVNHTMGEHWQLHPDGTGSMSFERAPEGLPCRVTVDPDGSVAFYGSDVVRQVFQPVLPLDQYLSIA